MEVADFIKQADRAPSLQFLLIGGYAVAAHGHTRPTFDVDFLVRQTDCEKWFTKLSGAGLKIVQETRGFAQFIQTEEGDPLDLMFVNDPTFSDFVDLAQERDFNGTSARVPSLDHLLALKLHALKQALPSRTAKDAEDVEMLARRNKLNLADSHYEALFLKYGTREIYETILR